MDIVNFKLQQFTVEKILGSKTSNIVAYHFTKDKEQIIVEYGNGKKKIVKNTPGNIEICENRMYRGFKEQKEKLDTYLQKAKVRLHLTGKIVLGGALVTPWVSSLVLTCTNFAFLSHWNRKCLEIKKELNQIDWVSSKQEAIDGILEETPLLSTLTPSSQKSILENGMHYTLNNYDNVNPIDREKIYQKVVKTYQRGRCKEI